VRRPKGAGFSVHGVEQGATTSSLSMLRRYEHPRYVGYAVIGDDKLCRRYDRLIANHDKIMELAVAEHNLMRPILFAQQRRLRDKGGGVDLPHVKTQWTLA